MNTRDTQMTLHEESMILRVNSTFAGIKVDKKLFYNFF